MSEQDLIDRLRRILGDVAPDMPLRHCIALALTYHLRDGVDVSELQRQEAAEA